MYTKQLEKENIMSSQEQQNGTGRRFHVNSSDLHWSAAAAEKVFHFPRAGCLHLRRRH